MSRGQSQAAFETCPMISARSSVFSYGLAFPSGSRALPYPAALVLLLIFPWVLSFSFRGTDLTLARFGQSILCPIVLVPRWHLPPGNLALTLLLARMPFCADSHYCCSVCRWVCLFALILKPVRDEVMQLTDLLQQFARCDLRAVARKPGLKVTETSYAQEEQSICHRRRGLYRVPPGEFLQAKGW